MIRVPGFSEPNIFCFCQYFSVAWDNLKVSSLFSLVPPCQRRSRKRKSKVLIASADTGRDRRGMTAEGWQPAPFLTEENYQSSLQSGLSTRHSRLVLCSHLRQSRRSSVNKTGEGNPDSTRRRSTPPEHVAPPPHPHSGQTD